MLVAPTAEHTGSGGPSDPDKDARARQHLQDIQRTRIIDAATAVAAELGVHATTVAHIVDRAGISRRTFYEAFENGENCLLAAFHDAADRLADHTAAAYATGGRWLGRTRAGLFAMLRFFDEDRAAARLLVIESLGAGRAMSEARQALLTRMVAAVDEAREDGRTASDAPALTADGAVGAVSSVLHARLLEAPDEPILDMLNPLMSMLVLPYYGMAAARRELERPMPKPPAAPPRQDAGGIGKLELRLTYRTMRMLAAVGTNPGGSNRVIGTHAGISDQGQTSKLLGRLQRAGLIENVLKERLRGEPNSWRLTERGERVHSLNLHSAVS